MCSMDYEMLVSHSPPVFSHSPPTGGFLTDYALHFKPDSFPRNCRPLHHSNSLSSLPRLVVKPPKRPCLVTPPEDPTSPTRLKKKVVFADDKGMSLTHVRVMSEPSDVPPFWSHKFLAEVTHGIDADPVGDLENWELTFAQPASDYLAFRKRLDTEKVSLENVIVKEGENLVLGTVKVSNLSFHKEVVVRSSLDGWTSHEDATCEYVPSNLGSGVSVLYDTFSFKIPLPAKSKVLEFCVCYRCDGREFWDNNHGNNYVLVKKLAASAPISKPPNGTESSGGVQLSQTSVNSLLPIRS